MIDHRPLSAEDAMEVCMKVIPGRTFRCRAVLKLREELSTGMGVTAAFDARLRKAGYNPKLLFSTRLVFLPRHHFHSVYDL
jgi:hypothetical protein